MLFRSVRIRRPGEGEDSWSIGEIPSWERDRYEFSIRGPTVGQERDPRPTDPPAGLGDFDDESNAPITGEGVVDGGSTAGMGAPAARE